ncbi:chromosome condensation protein-like protein [Clathrospora elynae]|uniref:Chromosome condensation protein-like protein n=1 Tax=Clathrospora elynae TaxID=706981 RepID=A0A6A5SVN3_9PLEO|nr:chromosome condensation protein-like protein [Clathrospora elynae]
MADTTTEYDIPTRRETHFSNQRSSLRSSTISNSSVGLPLRAPPFSDLHLLSDFGHAEADPEHADSDTLPSSTASPAPNVPYTRQSNRSESFGNRKNRNSRKRISGPSTGSRAGDISERDVLSPESWLNLEEENAHSPNLPAPLQTRTRGRSRRTDRQHASDPLSRARLRSFPLGKIMPGGVSGSQLDITALPDMSPVGEYDYATHYTRSKRTPRAQKASRFATELYTISYLIFFSIWGTLARLGLQALTFYPGAPVTFSELWANVAGTFIMGFLAEDRRLFAAEWGNRGDRLPEPSNRPADFDDGRAKARHGKVKKTIPMYIGLATGFCGSFTSFSSFIRDIFLSLSNDLRSPINHPYPTNFAAPSPTTTVPRSAGYSVMAILATIIITISVCYAALKVGAHLALFLDRMTPTLPFRFTRRVLDPVIVLLGWGIWIGAIVMTVFPPKNHHAWRGQALFACVLAPVGCLIRYYISLVFNPTMPSFPLGTFTVNIFGTAVLGMAYDLQHVPLSTTGLVGGSVISCQILQGVMDGFCGALTTVSTWILEIDNLKRRAAYVYGSTSVIAGLCLLVVIMGSVRWTVGWQPIICTT